ncbi:hypothetical protein D9C73_000162 [Collichthys lucidus]|uniref:HECT domain-containing protein n=1 Tax=Collichthys lucidus TaxID=240159 RepID=A0A4U5TWS2_COLLU|nr:hypothetical protein D9C73_000162 [Collichthys lucidus]
MWDQALLEDQGDYSCSAYNQGVRKRVGTPCCREVKGPTGSDEPLDHYQHMFWSWTLCRLSARLVPEVPMLKRTFQHADNDSALVQARVPPGPDPALTLAMKVSLLSAPAVDFHTSASPSSALSSNRLGRKRLDLCSPQPRRKRANLDPENIVLANQEEIIELWDESLHCFPARTIKFVRLKFSCVHSCSGVGQYVSTAHSHSVNSVIRVHRKHVQFILSAPEGAKVFSVTAVGSPPKFRSACKADMLLATLNRRTTTRFGGADWPPPKKRKQKGAEGFKVTWRKRDRNGNIIPQHLNLLALVSSQELRNYTKMKFLRRSQILILRDLLSSVTVPASPEVEETPTMSAWTQRQLTAQRRFRAAMPELLNCKLAAETVTKKFCQQCKTADVVMGSICGDTFHRAFREFAFCNFKKDDLCQTMSRTPQSSDEVSYLMSGLGRRNVSMSEDSGHTQLDGTSELSEQDRACVHNLAFAWDLPRVTENNRRWLYEKMLVHSAILHAITWPGATDDDSEDEWPVETTSRTTGYLREFIENVSSNDRKELLRFWTGWEVLPRELIVAMTSSKYPTAATCMETLRLPTHYTDFRQFQKDLEACIKTSNTGFGLI